MESYRIFTVEYRLLKSYYSLVLRIETKFLGQYVTRQLGHCKARFGFTALYAPFPHEHLEHYTIKSNHHFLFISY